MQNKSEPHQVERQQQHSFLLSLFSKCFEDIENRLGQLNQFKIEPIFVEPQEFNGHFFSGNPSSNQNNIFFSIKDKQIYFNMEYIQFFIDKNEIYIIRHLFVKSILLIILASIKNNNLNELDQEPNSSDSNEFDLLSRNILEENPNQYTILFSKLKKGGEKIAFNNLLDLISEMILNRSELVYLLQFEELNSNEISEKDICLLEPNKLLEYFRDELDIDLIQCLLYLMINFSIDDFREFLRNIESELNKRKKSLERDIALKFLNSLKNINSTLYKILSNSISELRGIQEDVESEKFKSM